MSVTNRLTLPLLDAGQAQKEMTHNEALTLLDGCVAACIEQRALASPPIAPAPGKCYLVAAGASGDWTGKTDQLAMMTQGGWRFVQPREGLRAMIASEGIDAVYRGGAWVYGEVTASAVIIAGNQVVGSRGSAIADPAGGALVDSEARAALSDLLAAVRAHGLIAA